MKILYHATEYSNLISILDNGIEARNAEKLVYLAETSDDAVKFLLLRGIKDIVTFKVKIYKKDEEKLIETFEHNYNIFKCRAFGYAGNIKPENVEAYKKYQFNR